MEARSVGMSLTKAIMFGGLGGIALPFAIGGSDTPIVGALVSMIRIPGPSGISIPWSWPVFCLVTLAAWVLLYAARE